MRIIFAGTPAFALPTLSNLHASAHEVVAVYTQPDRPAGRGRKLTPSPIKEFALTHEIPVLQPRSLKDQVAGLTAQRPDIIVVVAYGLLLPAAVLEIPTYGCINVHASLLPRWRGAAPIARAIEAGDSETGVTIMQMEAGLDTGPMLLQRRIAISDSDTSESLQRRLAALGAAALVETLEDISRQSIKAQLQDDTLACYAPKLQKSEAPIDWSRTALQLHRKIRALNPWPIATTIHRGKVFRLWDVGAVVDTPKTAHVPGTIVEITANEFRVQTGDGLLGITRLQAAGGRVLATAEFLRGTPLRQGNKFGESEHIDARD